MNRLKMGSRVVLAGLLVGIVFLVPTSGKTAPGVSGVIGGFQEISETTGNFTANLVNSEFGVSAASIGDFDGDGVNDFVVGANKDAATRGAVFVLLMNADETVKSHVKIGSLEPSFPLTLQAGDEFGHGVASVGDLDGDNVTDLVIGAPGDSAAGADAGALYVFFLNADGTVKTHQKITEGFGGFTGDLNDGNVFGLSVASLGDLDGDGVVDVAVGMPGDFVDVPVTTSTTVRSPARGAVFVLFLNNDGTVKAHQKINEAEGGFTGALETGDRFGFGVANLGDRNGDGVVDLGVGAIGDDDGGLDRGALYVLYLNADGTVEGHVKISNVAGITDLSVFGSSMASIGDFDSDGVIDLAVGAPGLNSVNPSTGKVGNTRGDVFLLLMNSDDSVKEAKKLLVTSRKLQRDLETDDFSKTDFFGSAVVSLGDANGDGFGDLFVGVSHNDDGGSNNGGVYTLYLK